MFLEILNKKSFSVFSKIFMTKVSFFFPPMAYSTLLYSFVLQVANSIIWSLYKDLEEGEYLSLKCGWELRLIVDPPSSLRREWESEHCGCRLLMDPFRLELVYAHKVGLDSGFEVVSFVQKWNIEKEFGTGFWSEPLCDGFGICLKECQNMGLWVLIIENKNYKSNMFSKKMKIKIENDFKKWK